MKKVLIINGHQYYDFVAKDFVGPDIDKGVRSDLIRLYILKNDTHTVSLGFSFKKESTDGLPDVVKVSVKGFNHSTQRLYFKQLGMFEKEEFTNRINSIIGHENFPNCSNNRIATIFKDTFSQKFSQRDYPT